ncbi:MAG: hypothetical protein ACK4TK_12660, partial [Thiobacillaceae bacterium]
SEPPAHLLDHGAFTPDLRKVPGGSVGFALWLRMLFSCLVDADFLDTEAYMDPARAGQRGAWPGLDALLDRFDRHMNELLAQAAPTPVNRLRAQILAECRAKAPEAPGVFSLTVPTGGGKIARLKCRARIETRPRWRRCWMCSRVSPGLNAGRGLKPRDHDRRAWRAVLYRPA